MEMPKVWAVLLKYSVSCVFFWVLPTETYNLVGFRQKDGTARRLSRLFNGETKRGFERER